MKIYIVNLERHKDRRRDMEVKLKNYGLTNYEFVTAQEGDPERYDPTYWKYNGKRRLISLPEIGCSLSHVSVYQKIVEDNNRALILEDDVCFDEKIKNYLDVDIPGENYIFFGIHTNLHDPKHIKGPSMTLDVVIRKKSYLPILDHSQDLFKIDQIKNPNLQTYGTYGYSPSVSACRKLIEFQTPIKVPADWAVGKCNIDLFVTKEIVVFPEKNVKSSITEERNKMANWLASNNI